MSATTDKPMTRVGVQQPSSAAGTGRGASMIGALVLLATVQLMVVLDTTIVTVQLMVVLDTTIVNVALPTIQAKVGFSTSGIAWVVNGYALTFGALLLLGGRSGDMLGRRNVFVAALGAFALASAIGGLASSPTMLIVARVVQGASAAFAQATALSLIVSTFPAGAARNRAVGVFAAMEGLGAAAGLLLGGLIVEYISWRWVFFLNVPVAASAALLAPRLIPAPTRGRAVFDLPGAATATVGLGLLVFGLSGAADHGWTTALTLGPILAGLLALATFVGLEARSKQPLMPLWVFRDRNRGGAYLIQALLGAALFGMFFLSTLFLQHVLGYSPLKAGAAFIPLTVVMIASAGLVSKLVVHTGVRPLIATGTAIAAIGLLWLSNLTPHSSYILGMTFVPATLSAVSGVKEEHSGLVSGVSLTAIQIGGAIGLAILATVAATTTAHQAPGTPLPQALTAGYTRAFEVSAIIIALAVPIALTLLRLRPTAEKGQGDDPSLADVRQHGTDAPAGAPSEPPLMAPVTVTSANGRTLDGQAGVHVTRQRQTTSTNKEQLIGRPRPSTPQTHASR